VNEIVYLVETPNELPQKKIPDQAGNVAFSVEVNGV
jgi:hypothetical protein